MKDTRANIIKAAARLFLSKSYTGTGVQTICNEANIQKGSFYHYFDSKQELALAVIKSQTKLMCNIVYAPCLEQNSTLQARLDCLSAIVQVFRRHCDDVTLRSAFSLRSENPQGTKPRVGYR